MRRQRHLSGGSKREVNTQTVGTVLQETDLDAVVTQGEPLKSALKQSGGDAGAAVLNQTETVKDEVTMTMETTTTQEVGAKENADPEDHEQ